MQGLFITGTDTGVGKTQVACALLALFREAGLCPAPMKPCESGCMPDHPEDALALIDAAGTADPLDQVCPYRFRDPVAPAVAARREGRAISIEAIVEQARRLGADRPLIVEGAGGLLAPYTERETAADLAEALGLPVVVVARAGLGTINHTALTVEALAARGLRVRGVVLNRAGAGVDPSEPDNPIEIARLTGARIVGPLPFVAEHAARREQFCRLLGREMAPRAWVA